MLQESLYNFVQDKEEEESSDELNSQVHVNNDRYDRTHFGGFYYIILID